MANKTNSYAAAASSSPAVPTELLPRPAVSSVRSRNYEDRVFNPILFGLPENRSLTIVDSKTVSVVFRFPLW